MDTDRAARFCPVCARSLSEFGPGPGGRRPHAACPHCGSLERHRLVAFAVGGGAGLLAGAETLELFCAGEDPPVLTGAGTAPRRFAVPATGLGGLSLPFGDRSFDLVVVSQVFDGRPDTAAIAAELARILRPGGVAVLHGATDLAPVLARAGLAAARQPVRDLAGPELAERLGLLPEDAVWTARRRPEPAAPPSPIAVAADGHQLLAPWLATALRESEDARTAAVTEAAILASRLDALEVSLRRRAERAEQATRNAERRYDDVQRRYDGLRARLPLRMATAVLERTAAVRRGLGGGRGVR